MMTTFLVWFVIWFVWASLAFLRLRWTPLYYVLAVVCGLIAGVWTPPSFGEFANVIWFLWAMMALLWPVYYYAARARRMYTRD